MRRAEFQRKTKETAIDVTIEFDNLKDSSIKTGVPFFDHMLNSMAKHGKIYMDLTCDGDIDIDDHHSVEDVGICLGTAVREALGEKKGLVRFGHAIIPMDDALTLAAVDLSGRPFYKYTGPDLKGQIGRYNAELTEEFLRSFAFNAGINLHIRVFYGDNSHHIHETIYKALGIAFNMAAAIDPDRGDDVPSTKGTIV